MLDISSPTTSQYPFLLQEHHQENVLRLPQLAQLPGQLGRVGHYLHLAGGKGIYDFLLGRLVVEAEAVADTTCSTSAW